MSSTSIPKDVRRNLWINSGGRCQFRGCNERIDRNFLTANKVTLAQNCHIVGDSPDGPRGDVIRSPQLAKSESNLILCCVRCHKTIDDAKWEGEYSEALLLRMKEEHELHIQNLYNATVVKRSHPFIVTGRINGTITAIAVDRARAAVLQKTNYTRFPCYQEEVIDLNHISASFNEETHLYWEAVKRQIDIVLSGLLQRVTDRRIEHLDIFALAQIPVLAYIGSRLGDRVPATVHQSQREQEHQWAWPAIPKLPIPEFSYSIPSVEGIDELAVSFSLSGTIQPQDIERALPRVPMASFNVTQPSTSLVDSESIQSAFVMQWRQFQNELHQRHGRISKLHIFPALPASLAVELGRCVLPKVIPEIQMWDFVKGEFVAAISW